jgi:lipoprotein-anchoring transpeptidase ErfK/SrfK
MRSGKHVARGGMIAKVAVLLATLGILSAMVSGAAYAGYRYEQARTARILPGVRIAGIDVGGMTREQAELTISGQVAAIMGRPIEVRAAGRSWFLTAQGLGTTVDVQGALDQAMAISGQYDWTTRLYHRLTDRPVSASIELSVSYDPAFSTVFVQTLAPELARAPRDAYLDFVDGKLIAQNSKTGMALAQGAARRALLAAVQRGSNVIDLSVRKIAPDLPADKLGMTIIIRLSQNKLYLYDGVKLVKTYSVATGQPGIYPTPQGHWMIINKRVNPTWVNPARDGWGKDEPAAIPPGPDNPLGTRALDLSAPGIRIHGTPDDASIGHYASHGCIRMHIWDSEDLFDRVDVGTPVIIAY